MMSLQLFDELELDSHECKIFISDTMIVKYVHKPFAYFP